MGDVSCVSAYLRDDARLAIASVDAEIVRCYDAVAVAERAGGNVSGLCAKLSEAGMFLSRARLAYTADNFDSVVNLANKSRVRLRGVIEEADVVRTSAKQASFWNLAYLIGSFGGSVGVIVCGFGLWFLLNRKHG
jgi:hypothetical protein